MALAIATAAPLAAQDSVVVQADSALNAALDRAASNLLDSAAAGLSKPASKPKRWDLTADLGLVNTAGNTNVTTFNVNQQFTLAGRRWRALQFLKALSSETDGQKSAEFQSVSLRGEHNLASRTWAYVLLGYDRNPFADVGQRFEQGAGVLVAPVATPRDSLDFEFGISVAEQANASFSDRFTFGAGRAAGSWIHVLGNGARFVQRAIVQPTLGRNSGVRFQLETIAVAPLTKRFSIRVSYRVQQDNVHASSDDSKVDRFLTTNLQVRF